MMHKHLNILKKILIPIFSITMFVLITKLIYTYTSTNNLFNNYKIKINGNKNIKNTLIKNKISYDINSSILNIDILDIRKKIEKMEYIHTIQISQILPNSLLIHVIERSPIVLINNNDKLIFMDSDGILLPINKKSIVNFPVPVLSIKDEKNDINKYKNEIAIIINHLLLNYPDFYESISEIIINSEMWTFHDDHKTTFYAKNNNLINQLVILKEFENTIFPQKQFKDYSYIDLRIKNKIIVKEKYRKG